MCTYKQVVPHRNKNKNVEGYRKLNFTWYMKNVESTIGNRSEAELGEANQKREG